MARGRMINQSIAEDIEFNELSIEAQLMFLRTIPFLDRDGLINGRASVLKGKVAPLLELESTTADLIQEWIDAELVISYKDGKKDVLFFPGFAKNQVGMRYSREPESTFAPPPGYERNKDGLLPIGGNMPPTHGNDGEDDDGVMPEECRKNAGRMPEVIPLNRIEENRIEGEYNACARVTDTPPTTNGLPPSLPNEYLPGLPDPRKRQSQSGQIAEHVTAAKALNVDAAQFRLVVDAILDGFGKKPLVDAGDERTLNYAQELALLVMGTSERFRTPAGIQGIFQSWRDNDWRGDSLPTSEQFKEHASLMASGKVTCTRKDKPPPPKSQTLNFKGWLLRNYNADNPTFIGISKSELEKGYQDYVKQLH